MKKRMWWIFGVCVLVTLVWGVVRMASSQRPDNLGLKDGLLAACPASPNCVSTRADSAHQHMDAIEFTDSPDAAHERLISVIRGLPRMTIVTERPDYLHVEATSFLFRFVDDIEFVIDAEAQLIHFRSASRVGHSDLGVNRARMERIARDFRAAARAARSSLGHRPGS